MTLKRETLHAIQFIRNKNCETKNTDWTTREKLALASAVLETGQEHWTTVSRLIQPFANSNRDDTNWCSPKECAKQYCNLLESMGKKKRNDNNNTDLSFKEQLVKKLTVERMQELQEELNFESEKQKCLSKFLSDVESGKLDDQVDTIWETIKDDEIFQDYLRNIHNTQDNNESETTEAMMISSDKKPRLLLHLRKTEENDSGDSFNENTDDDYDYYEKDNDYYNNIDGKQRRRVVSKLNKKFRKSDSISLSSETTDRAECEPTHRIVEPLTPSTAWVKQSIMIMNNVIDDANSHLLDNVLLSKRQCLYLQVLKRPHDIRQMLRSNEYDSPTDFEHDLLIVILNSLLHHPSGSSSHKIIKNLFDKISPLFEYLYVGTDYNNSMSCDTSSIRRSTRQKIN